MDTRYLVDMGNKTETWYESVLRYYWQNNVNKAEYPDFEVWLADMEKFCIISKI